MKLALLTGLLLFSFTASAEYIYYRKGDYIHKTKKFIKGKLGYMDKDRNVFIPLSDVLPVGPGYCLETLCPGDVTNVGTILVVDPVKKTAMLRTDYPSDHLFHEVVRDEDSLRLKTEKLNFDSCAFDSELFRKRLVSKVSTKTFTAHTNEEALNKCKTEFHSCKIIREYNSYLVEGYLLNGGVKVIKAQAFGEAHVPFTEAKAKKVMCKRVAQCEASSHGKRLDGLLKSSEEYGCGASKKSPAVLDAERLSGKDVKESSGTEKKKSEAKAQ